MSSLFDTNEALVKHLKNGNAKAYTFLVDQYHHRLCVYAQSLIKDQSASEDIVQNVFLRIWKKRKKLKDDVSIKNYLYRSTYNEFIDQYRKNQAIVELEKKYTLALDTIIEEKDPKTFDKMIHLVKKEIQNLSPRCKEVFIMSKQEGLTNVEISEHLNVSIKTVEAQITKAFSVLRNKLGDKSEVYLFYLFGKQ